ncbi:hypothetical protein HPP92_002198 [Vanilla planifolia]|uniref:EF-hand domain-containing protein n=1 Tax=Vanilla planifolia TaxID=51239 RepID=A0A835S996_VANPL|nr:hypothetical protein HPP92_002198 [Vanilla planifolia]
MGYEDFVYFILAEEDKSSEPSLEYWFRCIDLDGNGILTPNEMQFFYEEQLHRMECMAQEPVMFEDILCQMVDMISPERESYFTLRDLKGCKLSGNIFNILFNLNKFMAFETRDPFLIRQEYIRLSMEEDEKTPSIGSGDVWDESAESPLLILRRLSTMASRCTIIGSLLLFYAVKASEEQSAFCSSLICSFIYCCRDAA